MYKVLVSTSSKDANFRAIHFTKACGYPSRLKANCFRLLKNEGFDLKDFKCELHYTSDFKEDAKEYISSYISKQEKPIWMRPDRISPFILYDPNSVPQPPKKRTYEHLTTSGGISVDVGDLVSKLLNKKKNAASIILAKFLLKHNCKAPSMEDRPVAFHKWFTVESNDEVLSIFQAYKRYCNAEYTKHQLEWSARCKHAQDKGGSEGYHRYVERHEDAYYMKGEILGNEAWIASEVWRTYDGETKLWENRFLLNQISADMNHLSRSELSIQEAKRV